ncbi:MAG: hypothetical protein WDN69_03355 [Aliidongia sp.]
MSEAPGEIRSEPRLGDIRPGTAEAGEAVALPAAAVRERDLGTWVGFGVAFLLLLSAMALGGSLPAYADIPAFLMVFGGTAAVTAVSFTLEDMANLPNVLATTLVRGVPRGGARPSGCWPWPSRHAEPASWRWRICCRA